MVNGAILDLGATPLEIDSSVMDLAIPDNDSAGVSTDLQLTGEAWHRVHEMRVTVSIQHPEVRELEIWLASPSGDRALLFDGTREPSHTDLDETFDVRRAPHMMNHYNEPLVGTWQLEVVDRSATQGAGELRSWGIWHRF